MVTRLIQSLLAAVLVFLPICFSPENATPSPTPTATPIPTLEYGQTLGRVFPAEFHDQSVWSSADGNTPIDVGWREHDGRDYTIHFDVQLPSGFDDDDVLLSPVSGRVSDIYSIGDEGQVVVVEADPIVYDLEGLIGDVDEIAYLSKGIYSFDYTVDDVTHTSFHFGHIVPIVNEGDSVSRGQPIAHLCFDVPFAPKLAYVLYLHMRGGKYYQFSPCGVPNEDEFCGKCATNTPYRCP